VGRNAKQRAVIAARIKASHVKIPVIVCKNHQVTFNQTPLPPVKRIQQTFVGRNVSRVRVRPGRGEQSKLFMQSN
jgi:hypothetical protein